MPVPHRSLKGPPTLYGKSALLELYASPSYVVSLEPYSLGLHIISVSAESHGANDLSYPPQQQCLPD